MSDSDFSISDIEEEPQIVRNYRCTKDFARFPKNHHIIEECARNVRNVKLTRGLGKGTFGTVYLAEAMVPNNRGIYKPELVAVKRVNVKAKDIGALDCEVDYTYLMGEAGIGPKLYDAFYVVLSKNYAIQYIFMDPGDGDMDDLIYNEPDLSIVKKG